MGKAKELAKAAIRTSAKVGTISRLYEVLYFASRPLKAPSDNPLARALLADLTVRHGPFEGMRYTALGAESLPRLLGSYEAELHPIISSLRDDYSAIAVIGCAEGYYAVGLAMLYPKSMVYAFDTDPVCRAKCSEMAALNNVSERVIVSGHCDAEILSALPLGSRALIISDCEGYEKDLFSGDTVDHLILHDLIIELHDHLDIDISQTIKGKFVNTHSLTTISSVSDVQKARDYSYPETDALPLAYRKEILSEGRPGVMEWLVAKSMLQSYT